MARNVKNPAVIPNIALLTWARETAGLTVEELAQRLEVTAERLHAWEEGTEQLSMAQLRAIAEATGRPLPAFYLPFPPVSKPLDEAAYRTLGSKHPPNSHKAIFAQRKAHSLRETAVELAERLCETPKPLPVKPNITNPKDLGQFWRSQLNLDEGQFSCKNTREMFNWLRSQLEMMDVLIFQFPNVPTDVFRGLVIAEPVFPVIGLNWSDAYSAKNFTLIHEFAHVVFRLAGHQFASYEDEEVACNAFAGNVLVPESMLRNSDVVLEGPAGSDWSDYQVLQLAKHFKVSGEVVARRMHDVGLADRKLYQRIRSSSMVPYDKDAKTENSSGGLPRHFVAISLLGRHLPTMILSGYAGNIIGLREATEHLGVSPKHLTKLSTTLAQSV